MRYLTELAVFIGLFSAAVCVVWFLFVRPALRAWQRRRLRNQSAAPWTVCEHSDGMNTEFWLEHPTEKSLFIDEVSALLPAWEHQERLEELRASSKQKADDKNRR